MAQIADQIATRLLAASRAYYGGREPCGLSGF